MFLFFWKACQWGEHPLEAFEQKASDLMIKGLIHSYYSLYPSDRLPWTFKGDSKRQRSLGNYIRQSQRKICENCRRWTNFRCGAIDYCRVYAFQQAWKYYIYKINNNKDDWDTEYLEDRVNHLESSIGKIWKNRNNWKHKAGGFDE